MKYRLVWKSAQDTLKTRKMSVLKIKAEISPSCLPVKLFSSQNERTTCSFREKEQSEKCRHIDRFMTQSARNILVRSPLFFTMSVSVQSFFLKPFCFSH